MALYHKWYVKTGFTFALQFFMFISDGLGGVKVLSLVFSGKTNKRKEKKSKFLWTFIQIFEQVFWMRPIFLWNNEWSENYIGLRLHPITEMLGSHRDCLRVSGCRSQTKLTRCWTFLTTYNLFVTSKNEFSNSPIHEFKPKVLQNVFKIKNKA